MENILIVVGWIFFVIALTAFVAMLYYKSKGNVHAMTCELIALAETTGLPGTEKMANVVAMLYDSVPAVFKKFISQEMLQRYAQDVFDWMRRYAYNYLAQHTIILENGDVKAEESEEAQENEE